MRDRAGAEVRDQERAAQESEVLHEHALVHHPRHRVRHRPERVHRERHRDEEQDEQPRADARMPAEQDREPARERQETRERDEDRRVRDPRLARVSNRLRLEVAGNGEPTSRRTAEGAKAGFGRSSIRRSARRSP